MEAPWGIQSMSEFFNKSLYLEALCQFFYTFNVTFLVDKLGKFEKSIEEIET